MTEKKKKKEFKSLIRFHCASKIDSYNRGGRKGKKIQRNLQNKSKHEDNKCFSWVTAVRVLSLAGSHSPAHLPRMPSNTVLVSGPAVGAAQILVWSRSCVFLPPVSTAVRTSASPLAGALRAFCRSHRHTGCLVDRVGLICSCTGGGKVWVFFLSHTVPGFQLWFYSHLYMWVGHWGLLLRLPWRAWVCPCKGQGWRWCTCLGRRGSGSTRYPEALAARAAGNIVL